MPRIFLGLLSLFKGGRGLSSCDATPGGTLATTKHSSAIGSVPHHWRSAGRPGLAPGICLARCQWCPRAGGSGSQGQSRASAATERGSVFFPLPLAMSNRDSDVAGCSAKRPRRRSSWSVRALSKSARLVTHPRGGADTEERARGRPAPGSDFG